MASIDVKDKPEYLSSEESDEENIVIRYEQLIDTIKSTTRQAMANIQLPG